jgi:putative transposase
VSAFIDGHRERFGVEPICRTLDVSASAYYQRGTGERSDRQLEDERLTERIRELHLANHEAYGYRRIWRALRRSGEDLGRDRVARLMRRHGIQGAKRGGKPWRTTKADPQALRRPDLVSREFTAEAPNQRRVAELLFPRGG